jgi:spore maturation protein B
VTAALVPALLCAVMAYGLYRRVNVYDALLQGMREGLQVCLSIFPALLTMLVCITMLRASGAIDGLSALLAPAARALGMPPDCLPLALLRPFSGSGALAVGSDVMTRAGVDSFAGRVAAVMLGSSDTSFYVLAVYSACLGLKNTRYALPAALCADFTAFWMSALAVRLLMG